MIGNYELTLRDELLARGQSFVHQHTIRYAPQDGRRSKGTYQVDLADTAKRIAIEIQAGALQQRRSSTRRKRVEYLLNAGWRILFLIVPPRRTPISISHLADYSIAFTQRCCRDKSPHGQYGMIDRYGEPVSPLGLNLDGLSRVEGF